MLRKTFAEIDLDSFKRNLLALKKIAGEGVRILLPVKADAYGHGILEISRFAGKNRLVDMLGVSNLDEAVDIRNAGVDIPILLLGLILQEEDQVKILHEYDVSQTVADYSLASYISDSASETGKRVKVHLKVDTGMGRIGCAAPDAVETAKKIDQLDNVILEGIYSHFPVADEKRDEFTLGQVEIFKAITGEIEKSGIHIPLRHIANSAGAVKYGDPFFNMIRPGIMSYGALPGPGFSTQVELSPVMTLKSFIIFVKKVKKGTPLSYGLTYIAEKDSNIATVPIGYGDGYSRSLSNKGMVIINGRIYPVAGRVTMDQILVNLGDDLYPAGEEVILFGKERVTVNDIAVLAGTIPYEITCNISKRVPRIYINNK